MSMDGLEYVEGRKVDRKVAVGGEEHVKEYKLSDEIVMIVGGGSSILIHVRRVGRGSVDGCGVVKNGEIAGWADDDGRLQLGGLSGGKGGVRKCAFQHFNHFRSDGEIATRVALSAGRKS